MTRTILVCFCILCYQYSGAQNPKLPGDISTEMDLFENKIIAGQKIKRIRAEYSYKYDLQTIINDKKEVTYFFNEKGFIERKIEQMHYHNNSDSITSEYYYDTINQVTTYVKTEVKNHTVMLMDMMNDHHYKVSFYLIPKPLKWNENIDKKFLVWSDSIYMNGRKSHYFNQHGMNYKNYLMERSEDNHVESISVYSKDGRLSKKVSYAFNDNGELDSIDEKNLNPYMYDWKKAFKYDNGVFSEERFYKEGIQQYLRKITYQDNGLPELDIKRNDITKKMTIIQYKY